MKNKIALLPAFLLVACGPEVKSAPEPIVNTVEVIRPVAMPCIPKEYDPTRPEYADSDEALTSAVDAAERYALLWSGREQRSAREAEMEKAISACPQEQ